MDLWAYCLLVVRLVPGISRRPFWWIFINSMNELLQLREMMLDAEPTRLDRCSSHLCLSLFLSSVCSSKQTSLSVRVAVSLRSPRGRERTVNAQTRQNAAARFLFLRGKERKTRAFFSGHSSDSPLSRSVIQQENGSIESCSSSCQVTSPKWVLKLFLPPFFWWGEMEEAEQPVFKGRK